MEDGGVFEIDAPPASVDGGIFDIDLSVTSAATTFAGSAPALAGIGRRWAAYLLDNLLLYTVTVAAVAFADRMTLGGLWSDPAAALSTLYRAWLFNGLLAFGYFTLMIGGGGQTFGKMVMRIKVIRSDGDDVAMGRALLRTVGYFVSAVIFYIGFLMAVFDSRRQTLHDKMADTLVVEID